MKGITISELIGTLKVFEGDGMGDWEVMIADQPFGGLTIHNGENGEEGTLSLNVYRKRYRITKCEPPVKADFSPTGELQEGQGHEN